MTLTALSGNWTRFCHAKLSFRAKNHLSHFCRILPEGLALAGTPVWSPSKSASPRLAWRGRRWGVSEHQPIDLDDLHRVSVKVRELTDDNWLADMVELAAAEIARLREERRWVSVGERLPEDEEWVEIAGTWGENIGYFDGEQWIDTESETLDYLVTHWRKRTPGPK
jgi:hypothetical protein